MAGGDSYGASLSSSESSAASLSGATDASSSQYLFGTTYGPGALVTLASGDTPGTKSGGASASVSTGAIIAAVIAALVFIFFLKRR